MFSTKSFEQICNIKYYEKYFGYKSVNEFRSLGMMINMDGNGIPENEYSHARKKNWRCPENSNEWE